MKGTKLVLTSILALSMSTAVFAKAKITGVSIEDVKSNRANIAINFEGNFNGNPEISTRDGILQVAIPDSIVWPKIEKNVKLGQVQSTLMAYQYNKELVRFRALIPYSLVEREKEISLSMKDGQIVVSFPVIGKQVVKKVANNRAPSVLKKPEAVTKVASKSASDYDESYLQTLLNDKKVAQKDKALFPNKELAEDKVAMALSGTEKPNNGADMAFMTMAFKFTGFLALVLGLFFLIVNLFKKGVMKKGRLGFLNNTEVVTVLNTTYVGPKKSLMLVKVHKQVFLISNDEKGMHFLSEVKDTNGLLKEGEQSISGENFDTNLGLAEVEKKEFRLKEVSEENVEEESEESNSSLASFLDVKPVIDQVKLSDQIKNKVKNLKALQ